MAGLISSTFARMGVEVGLLPALHADEEVLASAWEAIAAALSQEDEEQRKS